MHDGSFRHIVILIALSSFPGGREGGTIIFGLDTREIQCYICTCTCFYWYCFVADGNVLQFEDGYLVETVVQGNELGVIPYTIRVSQDGELFAVDAENSNVVRITPPLSQCALPCPFCWILHHVDSRWIYEMTTVIFCCSIFKCSMVLALLLFGSGTCNKREWLCLIFLLPLLNNRKRYQCWNGIFSMKGILGLEL